MVLKLLINGLSKFFIKVKQAFSNGPKILPINPPNCTILDSLVFDDFILDDGLFAKVLRSLKTCLLVNNNLCRKLVSRLKSPGLPTGMPTKEAKIETETHQVKVEAKISKCSI